MKSEPKSSVMINQNQLIVFKVGLLQIVLAALLMIFLLRCTNKESHPQESATVNTAAAQDSNKNKPNLVNTDYIPIASYYPEETKQKLRELEKLNFEEGTLGNQLLDFLKKGDNDLGDEFKFIDLRFEKRNADINEKFAHEILDLATILNHFPNIKIKLMCYTDNVGDEKVNEKLSEDRGIAIRKKLAAAGIDENRVVVKGFGEKFPVGDNKTYDGQLINNRIEMMLLSK